MAVDLKVTPQTVLFQTTSKLREAIVRGQFPPGERLVETTLAEMMGVSRTTLREALRRLETERLVHNAPNRGPSVATISAQDAAEIYHVRKLLEGEAAALFAAVATDEQIKEAIAASALVRKMSTELNGNQFDMAEFKKQIDAAYSLAKQ